MFAQNGSFRICICLFIVVDCPPKDILVLYNQFQNQTRRHQSFDHDTNALSLSSAKPGLFILQIKSNLLLYSQYYAKVCNELADSISASFHLWATQLLSKECCNGEEPLAALCPIRQTRDLNLRPPAPEIFINFLMRSG